MSEQTTTRSEAPAASATGAVLLAALMGIGLIVLGGHVQADALHDAAHDVRHATGFPCH